MHVMDSTSSGTFNKSNIGIVKRIPMSAIRIEKPNPNKSVVDNSFFNRSHFPAPKNSLIKIPAPIQIPEIPSIIRFTTGLAIPVAASASFPINLPTIIESTAL